MGAGTADVPFSRSPQHLAILRGWLGSSALSAHPAQFGSATNGNAPRHRLRAQSEPNACTLQDGRALPVARTISAQMVHQLVLRPRLSRPYYQMGTRWRW